MCRCLVLRRRLVNGLQTVVDTVCALCNFLNQLCSKQALLLRRLRPHASLFLALDIIHERVCSDAPRRLLRLLAEELHGEGPQVAKFCVIWIIQLKPPICAGTDVIWALKITEVRFFYSLLFLVREFESQEES